MCKSFFIILFMKDMSTSILMRISRITSVMKIKHLPSVLTKLIYSIV